MRGGSGAGSPQAPLAGSRLMICARAAEMLRCAGACSILWRPQVRDVASGRGQGEEEMMAQAPSACACGTAELGHERRPRSERCGGSPRSRSRRVKPLARFALAVFRFLGQRTAGSEI